MKDYVNLWITINEPNVYVMGGWVEGGLPTRQEQSAAGRQSAGKPGERPRRRISGDP